MKTASFPFSTPKLAVSSLGSSSRVANLLERAQILAEDNLITLDDLPDRMQPATARPESCGPDSLNLAETERRLVLEALRQANGNKVHAAHTLGVTRRTLYRLIHKLELGDAG